MTVITKYKAYNGAEFTEQAACETYEHKCRVADAVIAKLPPIPKDDGCNFENGHGFVQHDPTLFLAVRRELLEQAQKENPHKWLQQSIDDLTVDASWAHRIIGESCTEQLSRAWARIYCTDKQFREWGQPFFASNPDKGEQIQLN